MSCLAALFKREQDVRQQSCPALLCSSRHFARPSKRYLLQVRLSAGLQHDNPSFELSKEVQGNTLCPVLRISCTNPENLGLQACHSSASRRAGIAAALASVEQRKKPRKRMDRRRRGDAEGSREAEGRMRRVGRGCAGEGG